MTIVITAGGTREKIDNVRSITNSSSGRLGSLLYKEYRCAVPDATIIYIAGPNSVPIEHHEKTKVVHINSVEELSVCVENVLKNYHVDIFVHSMAVADYTTRSVIDFEALRNRLIELGTVDAPAFEMAVNDATIDCEGKVSSSIANPAIILKPTEKVLAKVKEISPRTFLVGFKLLDNVSDKVLFDTAFNLLRKNRCNLVLANDIRNIRSGNHTGMLIYPEKTFDMIYGKENISKMIVEQSLERNAVRHPHSIQVNTENNISKDVYEEFFEMGKKLDNLGVLPRVINHNRTDKVGTYGNMSRRCDTGFYMTCRNVDKGNLKKDDLSFIEKVDIVNDENVYADVYYHSAIKPSIDTAIHSELYKVIPYSHIIHLHTDKIFLGYPYVDNSFPCGCDKECYAIVKEVLNMPETKVVQMRKHGLVVFGNSFEDCEQTVRKLFGTVPYVDFGSNKISADCEQHIADVNPLFAVDKNIVHPLKIKDTDCGCVLEKEDKEYVHFGIYTMSNIRGKGLHIVEKYLKLHKKPYILHTTVDCDIADFYRNKYGFKDFNLSNERDMLLIKKS